MAEVANAFSFREAERLHEGWINFYGKLFATFADGCRSTPLASDASAAQVNTFGFEKQVTPCGSCSGRGSRI